MDSKFFYNSSYRRATHATTMSEVRNLAETMERPRSVVLLSPAAGDDCNQASDNEKVPLDLKTAFEPAVELKVEEDIHDVEQRFLNWAPRRLGAP